MAAAKLQGPPKKWISAIGQAITDADSATFPLAIAAARRFPIATAGDAKASQALAAIADEKKYPLELRIDALSIIVSKRPKLTDSQFDLLQRSLSGETPVTVRSAAADALSKSQLSPPQLDKLCTTVGAASPLELNRLLKPFERSTDEALGLNLVSSLKKALRSPRCEWTCSAKHWQSIAPPYSAALWSLKRSSTLTRASTQTDRRTSPARHERRRSPRPRGVLQLEGDLLDLPPSWRRWRNDGARSYARRQDANRTRYSGIDSIPEPQLRSKLRTDAHHHAGRKSDQRCDSR